MQENIDSHATAKLCSSNTCVVECAFFQSLLFRSGAWCLALALSNCGCPPLLLIALPSLRTVCPLCPLPLCCL